MDPEQMMPPMPPVGMPPMDPAMGPVMDSGQQPITDEQYQNLTDLLESVREETAKLESGAFATANAAESAMRDAVKALFDELSAAGVDLNSQESVAAFLAKLEQSNPDLYQLFQEAVAQLLGGNEIPNESQKTVPDELSGAPEGMGGPEGLEMGGFVPPPESPLGPGPEEGVPGAVPQIG